ncbi:ribosome small subunit-dependent GTPase A [Butyrivibrio sp. X503]|uniref:ribosome small subunit-dependent GTPase A n=1 Tax=Butyrivibrio sp. X503 TaxID=2364878 RepID=UPI001313F6FB|nr:ribosome small subunit-dependent GTPase A [Butyrivibrio sp. X503]
MNNLTIRKETKEDFYNTEHMVMRAFWNIHGPGCNEHLMVHKLREAKEYLPDLSRVAEMDGQIVGAVFVSKARVVDGDTEHEVLCIGPVAVEPTCFSMGIGGKLLAEVANASKAAGYMGIVMCGEPDYYPKHGFITCDNFGIEHGDDGNFDAFMAYPLNDGFKDIHGKFYEAPVFEECEDEKEIEEYTKNFPYYKPLKLSCQWLHKERLGRISEIQKNSYTIRFFEKDIPAKLKGSFYNESPDKLPVVGDYVIFAYNPIGDSMILSVCERSSFLTRPDQAKTGTMQYMVANVDYTFIVTSLNEDYSYNRIARYVSVVLQGDSIPVVVLTKSDLCNNTGRYIREVGTISDKVRVHAISAIYGIGLEELDEYLIPGTTICFMGSSGAGKSTLLNAICGEEIMKTSEVRASDSTGRHTTTHRQLIMPGNGVSIIDTPGMRELGMAQVEEGLDGTFSDIIELESQCRFSDCKHETEPGCAIKAAIERGELDPDRYMLYKSLGQENRNNYAKKKEISKWAKAAKKFKDNNNFRY